MRMRKHVKLSAAIAGEFHLVSKAVKKSRNLFMQHALSGTNIAGEFTRERSDYKAALLSVRYVMSSAFTII
jgi:hypothetical protein